VDKKLGVVGTVGLMKVLGRATRNAAIESEQPTSNEVQALVDGDAYTEDDALTKMQSNARLSKIVHLFDMISGHCKKSMSCMLMFYDLLAELVTYDVSAHMLEKVLVEFLAGHATQVFSDCFLCEPEAVEQIQASVTKFIGCDEAEDDQERVEDGEEESAPTLKQTKPLLSISEWSNLNGSESSIVLKLMPATMQALEKTTSSLSSSSSLEIAAHKQAILLLCSLFRLMVAGEKSQNNGCLDGIDALLGCGLIMFEKMDMVVSCFYLLFLEYPLENALTPYFARK
jgi:hypothetical protein